MSDKETKGTKGEVWQTVLYRPVKGTEPWRLSMSFLEKLREAFGRLKPQEVEGARLLPHVVVPIEAVKAGLTRSVKCSARSLAIQINKKYSDIRATYVETSPELRGSILFQPRIRDEGE